MNAACIIPVREWKNSRTRRGYYRRKMAKNFDKKLYGERNKSETVFFVIKKKFGEELSSRSPSLSCLMLFMVQHLVHEWHHNQ